jgi:hypothetical protein
VSHASSHPACVHVSGGERLLRSAWMAIDLLGYVADARGRCESVTTPQLKTRRLALTLFGMVFQVLHPHA